MQSEHHHTSRCSICVFSKEESSKRISCFLYQNLALVCICSFSYFFHLARKAEDRVNYTADNKETRGLGVFAFPGACEVEFLCVFVSCACLFFTNQTTTREFTNGSGKRRNRDTHPAIAVLTHSQPVLTFVQHLHRSHWTCSLCGRRATTPVRG